MNAFSKRLKGTMSSYFDAGKDSASATAPPTAVFLTEVPNGAMDLALEDDAATLGKKRGLEVRSVWSLHGKLPEPHLHSLING